MEFVMKNKWICRILSAVLVIIMMMSAVSCAAPKLEDVKSEFIRLIEESKEINEILFGKGLSTYGQLTYDEESEIYYVFYYTKADGELCAYYSKETKEYKVLRVGEKGDEGTLVYSDEEDSLYLYATDLEYVDAGRDMPADAPAGYDFVRLDERYTTVNEISTAAAKVYSEDYLRDVFSTIMASGDGELTTASGLSAKYGEYVYVKQGYGDKADETVKYLIKGNEKTAAPLIHETREYDYSTMTVLKNSRKRFVTVEISSYGTYADYESGEVRVGWSTVTLSFVKQNGEWRLDTPTY